MTREIATALNLNEAFITNVEIEDNFVNFDMNGVAYYAKLSRGKFKADNMRRAV